MKSSQLRSKGLIAAVGLALLSPLLIVAPANAAVSCTNIGTSGTEWPFPAWTDYGSWVYVNGGGNILNSHARCGAQTTVWVQFG